MRSAALALALVAAPAAARGSPQPVFEAFGVLEVEVQADFNRDGHADIAYIVNTEDRRELRVATSVVTDGKISEAPPQVLALDAYPLVPASLDVENGVLVLKDLDGGTTAISTTYRFRWDAQMSAMRLIGLDALLYSRTYSHDGLEASWNLLTGDRTSRTLRLHTGPGDQAYDYVDEKRVSKPSPPIRLEDAPDGPDLLEWPGGQDVEE